MKTRRKLVWIKPELWRLFAALSERGVDTQGLGQEKWLDLSLADARKRHEKYAELCAARDLGQLYLHRGENGRARDLLLGVCAGIVGGSDNSDLLQAKALLDRLNGLPGV